MKTLENRVGTYLTGDEIADAVMAYSRVLAQEQRTEVVDIPFVAGTGVIRRVQILIGWQVDVNAIKDGDHSPELVDSELAEVLRTKAESVRTPSGDTPFTAEDVARLFDGDEYD